MKAAAIFELLHKPGGRQLQRDSMKVGRQVEAGPRRQGSPALCDSSLPWGFQVGLHRCTARKVFPRSNHTRKALFSIFLEKYNLVSRNPKARPRLCPRSCPYTLSSNKDGIKSFAILLKERLMETAIHTSLGWPAPSERELCSCPSYSTYQSSSSWVLE